MTQVDGPAIQVDGHVTRVDGHVTRVDGHVTRVDGHGAQVDSHTARVNGHVTRVDSHAARVDGRVVEQFEPGYPPSARGRSAHGFARRAETLVSAGTTRRAVGLEVMAQHTGHELTTDTLHGPLLTAVVDEPDHTALHHPDPPLPYPDEPPGSPRPLGRPLGILPPGHKRAPGTP
ncbi:hypothetical protein ACIA6T_01915 [Streptomyces sp. NPDC051740]|uniref:hypothetical protein n=1 Tax=Streptomyces sp. NPDC051740 TaxID=3365673 RepID=UPI00379472EC